MSTTMHAGLKRVGRGAATGLLASLAALFVAGPSFADIHLPTAWAQGDTEASSIYSLDTVLSVPDAEEDVAGQTDGPSASGPGLSEGVEIARGAASWYGGRFHGRRHESRGAAQALETLAVHAGYSPDPTTKSAAVPRSTRRWPTPSTAPSTAPTCST
jgi:hypothetical protein